MRTRQLIQATGSMLLGGLFLACLFTSCQDEPEGPNTKVNYLEITHSLLGKNSEEVRSALESKGFTYDATEEMYVLCDKDSTQLIGIYPEMSNGQMTTYDIEAYFAGGEHYEAANKHYNNWSNYAYNTIFTPISVWYAEIEEYDEYTTFMDGSLTKNMGLMLGFAMTSGAIDKETYQEMMQTLNNTRSVFAGSMNAQEGYLLHSGTDLMEVFAKTENFELPTLDLSSVMTGEFDFEDFDLEEMLADASAQTAYMEAWGENNDFVISFEYLGETELGEVMGVSERRARTHVGRGSRSALSAR